MKKSPKTAQLESLLQMKQGIFLDWISKTLSIETNNQIFSSFSQLNDPKIFAKLINIIIFEENTQRNPASFDILLEKWKSSIENSLPLFLENTSSSEIIESSDMKLLLLEYLYNVSVKNSKTLQTHNKPIKIEKSFDKSEPTTLDISRTLSKSKDSKENMKIPSQNNIKTRSRKENSLAFSPINRRAQVLNEEINVTPGLKKKLLNWLISINLLKKDLSKLEDKLPRICSNGVIYADLIERLHGKAAVLKGIIRQPKNKSQIHANFSKIFTYLRKYEKLCPRYLFHEMSLSESDPFIFWNFLDDLFYFFNNKISPFDIRYLKPNTGVSKNLEISLISNNHQIQLPKQYIRPAIFLEGTETNERNPSPYPMQDYPANINRTPPKRDSYRSIHREKQSLLKMEINKGPIRGRASSFYTIFTPEKSRRTSLDPQSVPRKSPFKPKVYNISEEIKTSIKMWLKDIGFRGYFLEKDERNLVLDPFRNGVLCYTLLGVLGYEITGTLNRKPSSIEEIRDNWRLSWENIRKNGLEKGFAVYFQDIDDFIKGDTYIIFEVLKQFRNLTTNGNLESSMPYSLEETKALEKTLMKWLKDLDIPVLNFFTTAKTGVLLCELTRKIFKIEVLCFKNPKNQGESLMNINKAIEIFRKIPKNKMGQRFLWKIKEISIECHETILGLLEDICRFYLELPAREGVNYFADGPITEDFVEKKKNSKKIRRDNRIGDKYGSCNKENRSLIEGGKNEKMYSFFNYNTEKFSVLREYNK